MKKLVLCTILLAKFATTSCNIQDLDAPKIEIAQENTPLSCALQLLQYDLEKYTAEANDHCAHVISSLNSQDAKDAAETFYEAKQLRDGMLKMLAKFSVALKADISDEQREKLRKNMEIFLEAFKQLQKQMLVSLEIIKKNEIY